MRLEVVIRFKFEIEAQDPLEICGHQNESLSTMRVHVIVLSETFPT